MDEHIQAWLEAYHDGELHGRRLQQVEDHLARCAECRREMERLNTLSALLQENPAPGNLMPPERFVAQVGLRLPRRQEGEGRQRVFKAGWQMIPLVLFGAWVFVQALFIMMGLLLVGLSLGLGDIAGQPVLNTLNRSELLAWSVGLNFALSAVIGLLYLSWLASWWVGRRHSQVEAQP